MAICYRAGVNSYYETTFFPSFTADYSRRSAARLELAHELFDAYTEGYGHSEYTIQVL